MQTHLRDCGICHGLLFDKSTDGILLADPAGGIYAANAAACRLLGRTEQEVVLEGYDGLSGQSGPRLPDVLREGARTGGFRGEAVFRRKDGVEIPVEISAIVLHDENGSAHASIVFREIAARREAEQALRKSETMLARAQQVANLGSWEWDIASGDLFWSDHHYRMLGFRPGEFRPTYQSFLALVHPDDRARLETAVEKSLAGEPYRIEFRVTLPDSSVRHILAQSDTDFDATGKPVRMVGTALDITGRKQAEEALRQREAQMEAFVDASPAILNIFDEDLRYIKTDRVTPTYFGLDREGIAGKSLEELAPEFIREFGPMMRRVIETGRPEVNLEVNATLPATGETAYWRASYFPVPLPGGKRGLGLVGSDITDLKRAERALRESEEETRRSEEHFRLLFETMQQGVIYWDADGRIGSLNPAAERILGRTAADAKGQTPVDEEIYTVREDGSRFPGMERPAMVALTTGREVRNVVMGVYNPRREEYRWIEVSAVPIFRRRESKPDGVYTIFEDITDRRRAAESLRESETRLRLASEAAGVGTFDFYPQTGQLVWSDITKGHFGMSPQAEIDHDIFLGAVHPADRERIRQAGLSVTAPGSGGQLATEYRTIGVEDGQERWVAVRGRVFFDGEGHAVRLIGTTLDISDRKRLEEQLRRRAEEVQRLMDVAPVAILVAHDPECREIKGNRAGNAMFEGEEGANLSLTPEGGTFRDWRFFRDGVELSPKELPIQVAAARDIEVRDWEAEALMPSGARRFLWGNAAPLRDAAGRVRGAVGAYQDFTASRQRTAAALHESEERFRNAADAAPIIMWYGDPQKRVTFFNKQITIFTGLPAEELIGGGWAQVIHPDDLEAARTAYYESVDKSANYQIEYRARRADGEYRHMLGTTSPRYIGDVYAGQMGTVIDITDLKRRQEEDLARQKLESLGTLAGGIAHDFNNLLGGILAQAELAMAEMSESASPEAEIENIRAVAARGAEIVRQLMVYAGQEADRSELVDVSRLVGETMGLLKVVVSKRATLRTGLGTDVPAVRANPTTLRQVLINLVTNASEAIGDRDGVIQVTTARMSVEPDSPAAAGGLPAGDYLRLEVSDTGCGMKPETQARIFDPFFTTKAQGRGLGLPVVAGIVRRLGGTINVRSEPGQGAIFEILLAGAGAPPPESEDRIAAAQEGRWAARGTVLIVEDEEALRLAVSRLLRKEGLTVLEAADGSDAIDILRTHTNDVTAMLLDITLPGIASPEVLREARRLRPDLRVVLTSAYSRERVAAMFAGLGFEAFLRKPYLVADFLKLLG